MKTWHVLLFALTAIVLFATASWVRLGERASVLESDLVRLGTIELTNYRGEVVSLVSFVGKPLVINAWAVWCPFCKKELPDFATLQAEFPEIVVIAIDRGEPLEKAKGYTDELGISDAMTFLMDYDDAFYRSIGGFSMPETLFVGREGDIIFHKRGPMTLEEMREAVRSHLNIVWKQ